MAGKSRKSMDQRGNSSSSSSTNVSEPDYGLRLSRRVCKRNVVSSLSEREKEKIQTKRKMNSSKLNRKDGAPSKKRIVEISESLRYDDTESSNSEPSFAESRKRPSSRGKRKSRTEIKQSKKGSSSTSNRSSVNDNDYKDPNNKKGKTKATVFSWLIDTGTVQENAKVFSVDQMSKQTNNMGTIRREGILCLCCDNIFTATAFHIHGGTNCNKPYESIFLDKENKSLFNCMTEAWNMPNESQFRQWNIVKTESYYDDACMICADGGVLMCCEKCNSTYHQLCIGMEEVPEGSWYCPYCVCKFCEDPAQEHDYLVICPQCEKKYHWECRRSQERTKIDLNYTPLAPFCTQSCKGVHEKLSKVIVGKKNELHEGYSWTLLHQMDNDSGVYIDDVSGIYIDDPYLRISCHSKLEVARRLMEECFEPIKDRWTKIELIPSVVYNCRANFNRINFAGFYTAVLEKGDEIISVASLRIHGTKLAEMPFIATNDLYRYKGMCRKLVVAIESALRSLNIENLIIPSVPDRISYWIERYGFSPLVEWMKEELMGHNTLMFHDSVRLQKPLLRSCPSAESGLEHNESSASFPTKLMHKINSLLPEIPDLNQEAS